MRASKNSAGFTLIELLVVVAVIALLIGLLLPALGQARLTAQKTANAVQLRSASQAIFTFGESNDGWYTGIDATRRDPATGRRGTWVASDKNYDLITPPRSGQFFQGIGTFPEVRFAELVSQSLVPSDVLIHPSERDDKIAWALEPGDRSTPYTQDGDWANDGFFDYRNFSYALNELGYGHNSFGEGGAQSDQLDEYQHAKKEWQTSLSSQAPLMSDRLYSRDQNQEWNLDTYVGLFSEKAGEIDITVLWNDGHADIYSSPIIENTRFGRVTNTRDNIFSRGPDGLYNSFQGGNPVDPDVGSSARMNSFGWTAEQPAPQPSDPSLGG